MGISVPLSDWGPRVRAQVQKWAARWPTFSWGTYPGHDPNEKLATDGMVPGFAFLGGRTRGRKVAQAIWDEHKDNGAWYVIHWGQIISITYPNAGWRTYFAANDPNPSKSHHNHVHISWHKDSDAPAVGQTAPDPVQTTPKPKPPAKSYADGYLPKVEAFYLDRQGPGVKNSDSVWFIQRALNLKPRDGEWKADREGIAVSKWQRTVMKDKPQYCDGILGPKQARRLFGKKFKIEAHS